MFLSPFCFLCFTPQLSHSFGFIFKFLFQLILFLIDLYHFCLLCSQVTLLYLFSLDCFGFVCVCVCSIIFGYYVSDSVFTICLHLFLLFLVLFSVLFFCVCFNTPWWPSDGKESTCNAGDPGLIPGWEDALEKGMTTHSSVLA